MDFNKIRLERLKQRRSQWELSKLTGIPPSKISRFENGWIDLPEDEVKKICAALQLRHKSRSAN